MKHSTLFLAIIFALFVRCVSAADRPNIIVIMADDLGYADVGCYGCEDIRTPHIDSLAKAGTRFTSGYVTGNMCGPSRAGFLTSRVQSTFGYYRNVNDPYSPVQGLPKMPTIASLLQEQGYVTGGSASGTWEPLTISTRMPWASTTGSGSSVAG